MLNINNLINEYKQGNKEVFDNIFMQEERQIKDIIKTFHHMEYEDLYQIACIGLLKAIKSYDTSKNIKFNSYMYNVVKNEILMSLRNNNTMKNSNMEEVSTEAQTSDFNVSITVKSSVVCASVLTSSMLLFFIVLLFLNDIMISFLTTLYI